MSNKNTVPPTGLEEAPAVFRQLANPRKWSIILYLATARIATASVIQRRCEIKQPTASRYLRSLTETGLLTKERVGFSTIYQINTDTWRIIKNQVSYLTT